jgi:hypothetical protein
MSANSLAHGRDHRCASTSAGPLKKAMVGSRKTCRNFSPRGALLFAFLAGALLSVADSFAPAMGPNCLRQKDAAVGRACRPMFASSGLFRPAAKSIAAAADARRLPAAVRGLAMAEGGAAVSKGKSVLIIAWFYAEPKQIELVKRIYKKKGFTDIVVQESPVKQISTPRGWYNTFVRYGFGITQFSPLLHRPDLGWVPRCCTVLLLFLSWGCKPRPCISLAAAGQSLFCPLCHAEETCSAPPLTGEFDDLTAASETVARPSRARGKISSAALTWCTACLGDFCSVRLPNQEISRRHHRFGFLGFGHCIRDQCTRLGPPPTPQKSIDPSFSPAPNPS